MVIMALLCCCHVTLKSKAGVHNLKGLCHEDIVVLSQFSAEIITLCLYPNTKFSCGVMTKVSNKFHQGALTIITCR